MIVTHTKHTNIAEAPEAISEVINKYTEHKSYVVGYSYPGKLIIPNSDIVHQHNKRFHTTKKSIIQYHSEPFRVELNTDIPKLVIAQYHATLPEYRHCRVVRNPVDLFDVKYIPKYQNKVIRIGYSPSSTTPSSKWADKGYKETIPILNKIKKIYKDKVDIEVITGVPLEECLKRKSECNIFIDEVKTDSYHRSGLESMAMGITTICSVSKEVEEVLLRSSNAKINPFINTYHQNLELELINLIESGLNKIVDKGYESRLWMENHWDPETIANEYIKIYEKWLD